MNYFCYTKSFLKNIFVFRRRRTLSFRNTNSNERNVWHSVTRGLPARSRRDALNSTPISIEEVEKKKLWKLSRQLLRTEPNNRNTLTSRAGHKHYLNHETWSKLNQEHRSRREVPECTTNYKAQRQLWLGCTAANVIDVRPLCNEEGDEGKI